MTDSSLVHSHDAAEFAALPDAVKNEVRDYLRELHLLLNPELIHDAGGSAAPRAMSRIGDAIARSARILCVSEKTMRRKYDDYRKTRDWRVLVNKSKCPAQSESLPAEFVEFWKSLCERNQRKCKPAYRDLLRRWNRGDAIPGYATPPCANGSGIPHGWSYRNLMRKEYQPSRFELVCSRVGRTAAAAERELVYTTRKNLWVGSHYMIDDMWHDFFVNTFAEKQAGRPLELFSHDLYSARKIRWGIRVRTRKDDGKIYHGLTKEMTRYIVAATLFLDGYSRRGTVMVVEHGAAGVDDQLAEDLYRDSGKLITISDSGMTGAAAHAGQYEGISRGNFRHKASLESSNNLTHNEFGDLPGQTGMDVAHRPEGLDALLNHNRDLLIAQQFLSPERAALLRFPLLELTEFMGVAEEKYRNIENYTEHELNDWIECGHVINEVSIGGIWIDQARLNPEQQDAVIRLIDAGAIETRARKMSRREVWDAGAWDLEKLPGFGVCHILGNDLAKEHKVKGNRFEFEDAEVGPGLHRYRNIAIDPDGRELELREGETYQVFINPFALDALFVRDVRGGYIGQCARIDKPCRADAEAVQRRQGAVAKRETELLTPLRLRHMAEAREKTATHSHNLRLLQGKPISLAERMQRIEERKRAVSASEFLDGGTTAVSSGTESLADAELGDDSGGLHTPSRTSAGESESDAGRADAGIASAEDFL